jgi:hypothetical protein
MKELMSRGREIFEGDKLKLEMMFQGQCLCLRS